MYDDTVAGQTNIAFVGNQSETDCQEINGSEWRKAAHDTVAID
jgi:hypothetical protein